MARRTLRFYGYDTEDGFVGPDRDEVRQALIDLEGSLYQLGGMFVVSVDRREIAPDEFETVGVVVQYDSFAPAQRAPKPKAEEPELEDEPDEPVVPEGIPEGATV